MFLDYVKKYEKSSLIISIFMLILACFLIFKPLQSVIILINIFGVITLLEGIIHIVSYFKTEADLRLMSFELTEGILELISGILIIMSSKYLTAFFPIVLGIWIIVKSIIRIQLSINLQTIPGSRWGSSLVVSILTLVLGILVLMNPFSSVITVTTLAGIGLAVYEIINIVESIYCIIKLK